MEGFWLALFVNLVIVTLVKSQCCSITSCHWSEWGPWTRCTSVFCGVLGVQKRIRSVSNTCIGVNPQPCVGLVGVQRTCEGPCDRNEPLCSTNGGCAWTEWNSWSICSATSCYVQGKQRRMRGNTLQCVGLNPVPCSSQPFEERPCSRPANPSCTWNEWSSWSACSANECDMIGSKRRTRSPTSACTGFAPVPCSGESYEDRQCSGICDRCIDLPGCMWEQWSHWSPCTEGGCGSQGRKIRTRTPNGLCLSSIPCYGEPTEGRSCNASCETCCSVSSCMWSAWSSWTQCSAVSCGQPGSMSRTRVPQGCTGQNPFPCQGSSTQSIQCTKSNCIEKPPCVDPYGCFWETWGHWSQCTEGGCGSNGWRIRTRRASASCFPIPCYGEPSDGEYCVANCTNCCPVSSCSWSSWSSWSQCSANSCNAQGTKTRTRTPAGCIGDKPKPCHGDSTEVVSCVQTNCEPAPPTCNQPAGCSWGQWGNWSQCTEGGCASQGWQVRSRQASSSCNPIPCEGEPTEGRNCSANCGTCCPTSSCSWGMWTTWSECTASCGQEGSRSRSRIAKGCTGHNPYPCEGDFSESEHCRKTGCVVVPDRCTDPPGCYWTTWESWSQCTEGGCGSAGWKIRSRHSTSSCNPIPCKGEPTEGRNCKADCKTCCPVSSCSWGMWSSWSQCSATECEQAGSKTRTRMPVGCMGSNPQPCQGEALETLHCTKSNCIQAPDKCVDPDGCVWNTWGSWSQCTEGGCGTQGWKIRSRGASSSCITIPCEGEPTEGRNCSANCTECCVASSCTWSCWSAWGSCSATICGETGTKTRHRQGRGCTGEKPRPCHGNPSETIHCTMDHCSPTDPPGCFWTTWNTWSQCTEGGCGSQGQQTRSRSATSSCTPIPSDGDRTEGRSCTAECETCSPTTSCTWSTWGAWSQCSATSCLEEGTRTRTRVAAGCTGNKPYPCSGGFTETARCKRENCVIQPHCADPSGCFWNSWNHWSACTEGGCGSSGWKIRTRQATDSCNPIPCKGEPTEGRYCHADCSQCCPVSGCTWGTWNSWSVCSTTVCGQSGTKTRERSPKGCMGQNPQPCQGSSVEQQVCINDCDTCKDPTLCTWTEWGTWSHCTEGGCGTNGWQVRNRQATTSCNPIPCYGEPSQGRSCTADCKHCCPVSGCSWGLWSHWSDCSATACQGSGSRSRTRMPKGCMGSNPQPCHGESLETQNCIKTDCIVNCVDPFGCIWEQWESWSQCTEGGCGTDGRQVRNRRASPSCSPIPCKEKPAEGRSCTANCNTCCPLSSCTWLPWGSWSECSTTVCRQTGQQTRQREARDCVGPKPYPCDGDFTETKTCVKTECHPNCIEPPNCYWNTWSSWSACNEGGCGTQGRQIRSREASADCYGIPCSGWPAEGRSCPSKCDTCCPLSRCSWTSWGVWSPCSASVCNQEGSQMRTRGITDGCSGVHPTPCYGQASEIRACISQDCSGCSTSPECFWTSWNPWSDCSVIGCGKTGTQWRSRNRSPLCSAPPCDGLRHENRACTSHCSGNDCGVNQQYTTCGFTQTCESPNRQGLCQTGCFCRDGYVLNRAGFCIPQSQCI